MNDHGLHRKHVVMVTEAGGGGVLSYLENVCIPLLRDYQITIVMSTRQETPEMQRLQASFRDVRIIALEHKNPVSLYMAYRRIFCKLKPDIVHLHSSIAGFIGRLAVAGLPAKVFYTPHCYAFLRQDLQKPYRWLLYTVEWLVSQTDFTLVAVSNYEGRLGRRLGVKKVCVVPNTVPQRFVETFNNGLSDGAILVGTAGRITQQKNPQLFLDIATRIIATHEVVRFVWIGGGSKQPWFEASVADLQLDEQVICTGWKDRDTTFRLINDISIYLHTATWEAQPIAVLEAMCSGKPIIIARFPGVDELVKHGENGFIADNALELRQHLDCLLGDEDLRIRMGHQSRQYFLERFQPKECVARLRAVYGEAEPI